MKQKRRYRRKTAATILPVGSWTPGLADELRRRGARYVGSGEHKSSLHPSYEAQIGAPALRITDASECPRDVSRDQAEILMARAFRVGAVSEQSEGGFPRYFWTISRTGNEWFRGRLINRELGWYKGHPVEAFEVPELARVRLLERRGDDADRD